MSPQNLINIPAIETQEAAYKKDGFSIWGIEKIISYEPPENNGLLVDPTHKNKIPLWERGATAFLLGPPGVGKSRLALQLAINHITGSDWCGLKCLNSGQLKWLFIGNENSRGRIQRDIFQAMEALDDKMKLLLSENLFIQVPAASEDSVLSIGSPNAVQYLKNALLIHKPDVVVLDPLEAFLENGDINSAADVRETISTLNSLVKEANSDATVLFVHHARTGRENTRQAVGWDAANYGKGSKTFYSMARFVMNLAQGDPEDRSKLILSCGKCNDSLPFETRGLVKLASAFGYVIDSSFNLKEWTDDIDGKRSNKTGSISDIIRIIDNGSNKHGEISKKFQEEFGCHPQTAIRRIKESVKSGKVRKDEEGEYHTVKETSVSVDSDAHPF